MSGKRNVRFDIMKAIGIMSVVIGHTQAVPMEKFVNLYHVGLFFIISGIFYKEEYTDTAKSLGKVLVKRIKRLYVPFVLYNLFFLCFRNLLTTAGILDGAVLDATGIKNQIIGIFMLTSGEVLPGPDWFIRALFLLEAAFSIVDYITKKVFRKFFHIGRWIIAVGFLILGYLMTVNSVLLPTNFFSIPLNIGTILSCWILFAAGMDLPKVVKRFAPKQWKVSYDVIFAAAGFAALVVLMQFGGISYADNAYPNIPFMLICNIAGFVMAYGIAGLLERSVSPVRRFFTFMGGVTLEILMMHLTGFKIITIWLVLTKQVSRSSLSAFPIATADVWPAYFITGLAFSLLFAFVWGKIKQVLKDKLGWKRLFVYVLIALVCVFVPRLLIPKVQGYLAKHPNYELVFDKDYYLEKNPDVANAYGSDASYETVFEHFINFGMKEGRTACESFDPNYYRNANPDLDAAFGDDWTQYYIHYMVNGINENRKAVPDENEIVYKANITASENENGEVDITLSDVNASAGTLVLLSMDAYETDLTAPDDVNEIMEIDPEDGYTVSCTLEDINYKYVLAEKNGDGYTQVSNFAYIDNAGEFTDAEDYTFEAGSKKGLQMGQDMISDVENLETKNAFTNLIISQIMTASPDGAVEYTFKGNKYYFSQAKLEELDSYFSELTDKGIQVTCGVINLFNEDLEELYYPAAFEENSASFFALNTSTKEGLEFTEAFISFISERYNGSDKTKGLITNWTIGNEVNESGTYNYMGEHPLDDYLTEYTRTFRVLYNIIKTNNPGANIYVPIEPWWGVASDYLTYGGREFMTALAEKMNEEGNIDWGLAYHAYSYPLSDPKVINDDERTIGEDGELTLDGYYTVESENSVTITMKNIDVLVNFMHKDEMLTKEGEVRSIILSEQGYTSNSNLYGQCEAQQAASLLYAYYKAEMTEDIDSFIYFLQKDDTNASLGNSYYLFGLQSETNGELYQKLSYRVFRLMDSKDSLTEFSYLKDVLGIDTWSSEIDDFDESFFDSLPEVSDEEGLTDISDAQIADIEDVTYTGSECLPEVTVTLDGQTLVNDVDYDAAYVNNTEKGTAQVVIIGIGKYSGEVKGEFTIK